MTIRFYSVKGSNMQQLDFTQWKAQVRDNKFYSVKGSTKLQLNLIHWKAQVCDN